MTLFSPTRKAPDEADSEDESKRTRNVSLFSYDIHYN